MRARPWAWMLVTLAAELAVAFSLLDVWGWWWAAGSALATVAVSRWVFFRRAGRRIAG